ncbi:MAG: hypothetical protein ACTSX1_09355 [Candidatus Heimdallarchaeaceae archaeon]
MSVETEAKLRQMRDAVPEQSDALANSIVQVQEQIADLTAEATSLQSEITTPNELAAIDIIENTILPDKTGNTDSTSEIIIYYVSYGSTFGTINWSPAGNLTDWRIRRSVTPIPPPVLPSVIVTVYTYTPGDYPDLDILVNDYAFTNDYLTRPLYASGLGSEASYGIYPTISNLQTGKQYLDNNKAKIDSSESVLSRYID